MDLQSYLDNAVKASRQKTLANSDQLTLGELILKFELIAKEYPDALVGYDFEYLYPTSIDSWRGSYAELALNFDSKDDKLTAIDFLKLLNETVGETFEGYKGGDYTMSKHTPIWVANYGNSGNTAVIEVISDNKYEAILITGYREF